MNELCSRMNDKTLCGRQKKTNIPQLKRTGAKTNRVLLQRSILRLEMNEEELAKKKKKEEEGDNKKWTAKEGGIKVYKKALSWPQAKEA